MVGRYLDAARRWVCVLVLGVKSSLWILLLSFLQEVRQLHPLTDWRLLEVVVVRKVGIGGSLDYPELSPDSLTGLNEEDELYYFEE